MRRAMAFLALAPLAAACQETSIIRPGEVAQYAVIGSAAVQQVTGAGTVVREDLPGAPRESYGFRAQIDAAGQVGGSAEVHFPSDEVKMAIDIRCLAVQGNEAWLSGPVTRSADAGVPVGRVFLWRVEDNGEGEGAAADRISSFVYREEGNFQPDVCRWKPSSLVTHSWDNGNIRIATLNATTLEDLVGTWDATKLIYINQANPADTLDVLAAGASYRWTVAPTGRFTMLWWQPARIFENTTGSVELVDGRLVLRFDGQPDAVDQGLGARTGNVLYIRGEGPHDWDGDGSDEASDVIGELRVKRTGILIGDLAGSWQATAWRYTSTATPSQTVDLVADEHVAITLTLGLDSHWTLALVPGGTREGDLLVEGGTMLIRTESREDSPPVLERAFSFWLARDTWAFAGASEYDFGGGTPEPATLGVVLIRR